MRLVSTRGEAPPTDLPTALFQGLAPDGGLYMPERLRPLGSAALERLPGTEWPEIAETLASHLLGTEAPGEQVGKALDFPIPMVPLGPNLRVLELFHGPTLAFKDVGARFMARLMAHHREALAGTLTVLTATSGDTGGAVAQAFLGIPGTRVVVLFPDGKVSPRQERQFSTLGGNVHAVAVQGDFDDCQRLAKAAFQDEDLRRQLPLTSANSINIGRLLPQMFYYFLAWARLAGELGPCPIVFSVPSGNFGNLTAGLMARAIGLPASHFIAATNRNDTVPRYLETGRLEPKPSRPTLSTAMDVGEPSNLDRILHLYRGRLSRIREHVTGRSLSDEETRSCIRRVHEETGYVLDPHSAVGYRALADAMGERGHGVGVLLATAHPAKFAEVVEPIVEEDLPIPEGLARYLDRERKVTLLEPREADLKELLLDS
jgi:threonine synthase